MAKTSPQQLEEDHLTKKLRVRLSAAGDAEADPVLRSLRKRLKRVQRKRRLWEARQRQGTGKKAGDQAEGGGT